MYEKLEAWAKKRAVAVAAVYEKHKTEVVTVFILGMIVGHLL